MAAIKGKWRVYYNMKEDYPFVFSIDDGTSETEQNFTSIAVNGHGEMKYDSNVQPHCWLEVEGEMEFERGRAVIWGGQYARQRQI